jgi:heat shock protein beta
MFVAITHVMLVDPIWLFTQVTEEVPIDDEETPSTEPKATEKDTEGEEAIVEDASETEEETTPIVPKTVSVMTDKWVQLNAQAPIWMR